MHGFPTLSSSLRLALALSLALAAAACADRESSTDLYSTAPAEAVYDAALKAPVCAGFTSSCDSAGLLVGRADVGPEPNQPNTLGDSCADGVAGSFHADESLDRLRVSTTDGSFFEPGKTVVVEADVWAWAGFTSDRLDLYAADDAHEPRWNLITTLIPGQAGPSTLVAEFALPEGELQAIRGVFRYSGAASPCGTGSWDDHDDLVFAVGRPDTEPPEVSLASHVDGDRAKGKVYLAADATDNLGVTRVDIEVDGALVASVDELPYRALWDTLAVSDGEHVVTATAHDEAGNSSTHQVTLTVHNSDGEGNALHDPVLLAPGCRAVASECDAGDLVLGRGVNAGPEPNQPNTLGGSCADGEYGVFRSGEQLDRIRVYTEDGEPMAAGATVTIEATVWADWSDFEDDYLDLYHTADATDPAWTYLGTLQPDDGDAQILSLSFTLPEGGLQAVRGVFRWVGWEPAPCDERGWTDHDDLVFAVE